MHMVMTGSIHTKLRELAEQVVTDVTRYPAAVRHTILRTGDTVIPTAIDISGDIGSDDALCLEIGGTLIHRIPLSILFLTGHTKGSIHTFDFSVFFPAIELSRLQSRETYVYLESGHIFGIHLLYTYLETRPRRALTIATHELPIQQVSTWAAPSGPTQEISTEIAFEGYSKGYIVEAPKVSQLRRFHLQINGETRWDHDTDLLTTCAVQLSPTHLWIPFNLTLPQTPFTCSIASYKGGLYHSRIERTRFDLEFTEPQEFVKIHSIDLNVFLGQGGVQYTHDHTPTSWPVVH